MDFSEDACYRALTCRDARLDGRVFVGVKTTGIYCRPVCPARTPKRIELVNLGRQMALPEFARAYPSTVGLETIGLINGVGANQVFPGGALAKRVVGGRLPD